ncbi:CCD40 protein, partial [Upupa epops]|nr:CCD40 protein [Upupa epops]
ELASRPPEVAAMEQTTAERENPPFPSGTTPQPSALSRGNIEEPVSLSPEAAVEQVDELPREHGDQSGEEEHLQHRAEAPEVSGRHEEATEDKELLVLAPDHPLMKRFQAALKSYLTKQVEKVNLELQELRTATKKSKAEREELGVILYGVQQQLARLQRELEKSRKRCSQAAAARQQLEEELEGLRLNCKQTCQSRDDERQAVAALQTQVESLALRLFYAEHMDEDVRHRLLLTEQSRKRAEADKSQAEVEKRKQDLLLERLTRQACELREQIALSQAQSAAQAEDTRLTRQAVSEALMEMQAINVEKKQLLKHWGTSLAGVKQRDEALAAAQELLSKYRHELRSLEANIRDCRKSLRKEEERSELLVAVLSRSLNDASSTKKLIARCLSRQEALRVDSGTCARMLQETEQALSRAKADHAARLEELLSLGREIEKGTRARAQLEKDLLARLQDQRLSGRAARRFSQLAARLRRRKTDLELHVSRAENDRAQAALSAARGSVRLAALRRTLGELGEEIAAVQEAVGRGRSELARRRALTDSGAAAVSRYNRRLELLLSRQGGQEPPPLEAEIGQLTQQIEERSSEAATLQQRWLKQQQELVELTQEREQQLAALAALGKQMTVLQQRRVRTESAIQQEAKEQRELDRHARSLSADLLRLSVLMGESSSSLQELQSGNVITENEFVRALKEAEKESLEMQERLRQLTEEKERLQDSLLEAEQQVMLWERKIQLAREMRAAVDSEPGQGQARAMRAEIHRMQVRYGQLVKQQERRIRDLEASVSRREAIATRGEGQSNPGRGRSSRSRCLREKRELLRRIRETQKSTLECTRAILQLESSQAALSATLSQEQQQLQSLRAEAEGLDWDAEHLGNRKRWNLLEIVSYQRRQRHLQALRDGTYVPLCRSEPARRDQQQRLQHRLHSIGTVVRQIQQDHPQHRGALQWLRQCLEARLGCQE